MRLLDWVLGKPKKTFADKVIHRYRKRAPISPFVRELFANEPAETINQRFKKVRERMSRQ